MRSFIDLSAGFRTIADRVGQFELNRGRSRLPGALQWHVRFGADLVRRAPEIGRSQPRTELIGIIVLTEDPYEDFWTDPETQEWTMHGSVRKYRMNPEMVETVAVKVEDGFVPIVSKLPGFVSYMVFEGEDGLIVTVSVFETEEAANQSADAARDWIKENVSDYVEEPLEVTTGELIVSAPMGAVW